MRKKRRNLKGEGGGRPGRHRATAEQPQGKYCIIYLLFITQFFKYFIKYLYLKKLINARIIF